MAISSIFSLHNSDFMFPLMRIKYMKKKENYVEKWRSKVSIYSNVNVKISVYGNEDDKGNK